MGITATAETLSTVKTARRARKVSVDDMLGRYASQHPLDTERFTDELVDARENFNPDNYQNAWAAGEELRALIHRYRNKQ